MALQQITLRTKETQKQYMDYLKNTYKGNCIFCDKELLEKEFEYWIIIKNKFPYDKVFCNHRLLATKRHVTEEINNKERKELKKILAEEEYNHCILNKKQYRSIPQHFHYHLVDLLT